MDPIIQVEADPIPGMRGVEPPEIEAEEIDNEAVHLGFNENIEGEVDNAVTVTDTPQKTLQNLKTVLTAQGATSIKIETARNPNIKTYKVGGKEYFKLTTNYTITYDDGHGHELTKTFTKTIYPQTTNFDKALNLGEKFDETMKAHFLSADTPHLTSFTSAESDKAAFLSAKIFSFKKDPSPDSEKTKVSYMSGDTLVSLGTYNPVKEHYVVSSDGLKKINKANAGAHPQALQLTPQEKNKIIKHTREYITESKPESKIAKRKEAEDKIETSKNEFLELMKTGPIFNSQGILTPAFAKYNAKPPLLDADTGNEIKKQLTNILMAKGSLEKDYNELRALRDTTTVRVAFKEDRRINKEINIISDMVNVLFGVKRISIPESNGMQNALITALPQIDPNIDLQKALSSEITNFTKFAEDNKVYIRIFDKDNNPTRQVFGDAKNASLALIIWESGEGYTGNRPGDSEARNIPQKPAPVPPIRPAPPSPPSPKLPSPSGRTPPSNAQIDAEFPVQNPLKQGEVAKSASAQTTSTPPLIPYNEIGKVIKVRLTQERISFQAKEVTTAVELETLCIEANIGLSVGGLNNNNNEMTYYGSDEAANGQLIIQHEGGSYKVTSYIPGQQNTQNTSTDSQHEIGGILQPQLQKKPGLEDEKPIKNALKEAFIGLGNVINYKGLEDLLNLDTLNLYSLAINLQIYIKVIDKDGNLYGFGDKDSSVKGTIELKYENDKYTVTDNNLKK